MPDHRQPDSLRFRWADINKHLRNWSRPAFLSLVKDLYHVSAANRAFLHARLAQEASASTLEVYRRKVLEQFFPERGEAKLRLAEARKAIRDYRKATGNISGTIDLLLTYVENGSAFAANLGYGQGAFFRSLESAAEEMRALLLREEAACYVLFRARIVSLGKYDGEIGWGYGDYLGELVDYLESEFRDEIGNQGST